MDIKPKRRWYQFSLRTLLVLMAIACVGFGWLGYKVRAKQREQEAVKAIRNLGGFVAYEYEMEAYRNGVEPMPPAPAWLRNLMGHDFFADIEAAGCGVHGQFSAQAMSSLRALPRVRELYLRGYELTDGELAQIGSLPHLEKLLLSHTPLSDVGLFHLQGLTRLESLDLGYTQLTDAGLPYLHGLRRLKQISLVATQVTDAGVEELQKALPNLTIDRQNLLADF